MKGKVTPKDGAKKDQEMDEKWLKETAIQLMQVTLFQVEHT